MMVSTRMARTPQPAFDAGEQLSDASRSLHAGRQGRGRALAWGLAGLIAGGLVVAGVLWRGRVVEPPHTGTSSTREIVVPPPDPEPHVNPPPPRVTSPEPEPRAAKPEEERPAQPNPQEPRKKHVGKHAHNGQGPGIDQNGVGIPQN